MIACVHEEGLGCSEPMTCAKRGVCPFAMPKICLYGEYVQCRARGCKRLNCHRVAAQRTPDQVVAEALVLMGV